MMLLKGRGGLEVSLMERPQGMLEPSRQFGTHPVPIPDPESLARGRCPRVRVAGVSCAPIIRALVSSKPMFSRQEVGDPVCAYGVGKVKYSKSPRFSADDVVDAFIFSPLQSKVS
jgi:NADPH-dependent curcumin reductase CurA